MLLNYHVNLSPTLFSSTVQEMPESSCSASLEEAGITVTRTTSMENLEDHERRIPQQTDHLSQSYSHSLRTPTPPKSTSPLPPHMARPHSVADFRHRRYRRTSSESNRTQSVYIRNQVIITKFMPIFYADLHQAHIKGNNYFPVTHTEQ